MVSKGRHPKAPIAKALKALDSTKFEVVALHTGHRWGIVRCLTCGDDIAIWSTPRVPEHNADAIRRFAHNHNH